jgi:WD40 repeat protein
MVCASAGDTCQTFNTKAGELNDLQFSQDDHFLAVANDNIQFVALDRSNESFLLRTDRQGYGTVRFDKSGTELLTITSQSKIELIDVKSHAVFAKFCCSSFYGEVAFLEKDTRVANAGHWPRIWTRSGQLVASLARDREYETFRPIAVHEEVRKIFMGSQDGRVYVWSLDDFTLSERSPAQAGYVDTIALVPKARLVAYCSFGKPIHLWSATGNREAKILNVRPSSNLVSLPDGVSILFGTSRGTAQIWNLKDPPRLVSELRLVR